jgi:predicted Zn-dependent protease
LLCALLGACGKPLADLAPGERPALDTDEAGFWMQMERAEDELRTSGRLVRDEVVASYVQGLTCTLSPEYCDDIRTYIVQTPEFNASMGPNGALQVWTGLMLRVQNEAQFAFVLAHEIAHFQRRHTLQRWRDARVKTNLASLLQLASLAAGYSFIGDAAMLATMLSLLQFDRDQEREADELGFQMLLRVGYDPLEAPKIWNALNEELEFADEKGPPVFLSTHPSSEERLRTLGELAQKASTSENRGVTERERYLAVMARIRRAVLRDELRTQRFKRTELLLTRLMEAGVGRGEIAFYRGELCRLRGQTGDAERSIQHYQEAVRLGGAPAETHRSLGLVYRARGELEQARRSFDEYLKAEPGAQDRLMIEAYLRELQ